MINKHIYQIYIEKFVCKPEKNLYLHFVFLKFIITNNEQNTILDSLSTVKYMQEDKLLIELHNEAGCFQRWKFISAKMKEKGISKT